MPQHALTNDRPRAQEGQSGLFAGQLSSGYHLVYVRLGEGREEDRTWGRMGDRERGKWGIEETRRRMPPQPAE